MFYWLSQFSDTISALRLLHYITFRTGGAVFTAGIFVFLFGPMIINRLRLWQGRGQSIRPDGPQSHLVTTPIMGGLVILSGFIVSTVLWANPGNPYVWVVLGVTLGLASIGFYDDYLKVTRQTHAGISGRTRLVIEFLIAGAACYAIVMLGRAPMATSLAFPFFKNVLLDLGWFFMIFGAFILVGAGNVLNLADGLDGLAIGLVMIAACCFGAISWAIGNGNFVEYLQFNFVFGAGELAVLCGAVLGAGLGFLWLNCPPSSIFMGDTGALALGGLLGTIAVITKHEIVFAIIGGLFAYSRPPRRRPGGVI
jgi:phospho-N-acetylmuramoyl-pentapeptide-transferase